MSWQQQPQDKQSVQSPPRQKITNFYQLLHVDKNAHPVVIRYAYRYLAAMYHPDNVESGDTEKFKLITEAWRTLSDPAKRQAYDIHLGSQLHQAQADSTQASTGKPLPFTTPIKTSLTWDEVELRIAILQVLLEARKRRPQTGGASAKMLMDCLNCSMEEIEFVLWYLREKDYIVRADAAFMITADGIDYLLYELSKIGPMSSDKESNSGLTGVSNPHSIT